MDKSVLRQALARGGGQEKEGYYCPKKMVIQDMGGFGEQAGLHMLGALCQPQSAQTWQPPSAGLAPDTALQLQPVWFPVKPLCFCKTTFSL